MVRERLVPVQERTLFRVKAILRTLPIRRPWIRQSLAPRRSCIVWPLLAKRFVFSLSVQVRSLRKESMHVLNGKGSDSDGSRRIDRVEPTPTREQTALGRRFFFKSSVLLLPK